MSQHDKSGRWYLGTMNDAMFIISGPSLPAPDDTGPYTWPSAPNPISAAIDDRNGKLIVDAHNAELARLRAELAAERERCACIAEEEIDAYHEGMSAVDVRLSITRGPRWRDGREIAAAIRAPRIEGDGR